MEIFVECYGDEALIQFLGFQKNQIRHSLGIGKLSEVISKTKNSFALIDKDPTKTRPNYIQNLKKKESKSGIEKLIDTNNNILIQIDPDLEGFLLKCFSKDILQKLGGGTTKESLHEFLSKQTNQKKFLDFLIGYETYFNKEKLQALKEFFNSA